MTLQAEVLPEAHVQFFNCIQESMLIKRPVQLFMWLQGNLQSLLPHDVLLVAYGDLSTRKMRYEAFSAAGSLRGAGIAHSDIEGLIGGLFDRWQNHGRSVYSLETPSGVILNSSCQCNLHRTLRGMRSLVVHGIRDERSGEDVMYVTFRSRGHFDDSARRMFELLLPHIDCAARRVAGNGTPAGASMQPKLDPIAPQEPPSILTERESEILHWVGNGKTNYEIGIILGISQFTVKNHLQRIFRKIDVSNRAQAISRVEEMNRQHRQ